MKSVMLGDSCVKEFVVIQLPEAQTVPLPPRMTVDQPAPATATGVDNKPVTRVGIAGPLLV